MALAPFLRRLERLRRERGWTQNELARRAGLRPGTLSRVLTGARPLQPEHVARLAEALGVTHDDLSVGLGKDLAAAVPLEALKAEEEARSAAQADADTLKKGVQGALSSLSSLIAQVPDEASHRAIAAQLTRVATLLQAALPARRSKARA